MCSIKLVLKCSQKGFYCQSLPLSIQWDVQQLSPCDLVHFWRSRRGEVNGLDWGVGSRGLTSKEFTSHDEAPGTASSVTDMNEFTQPAILIYSFVGVPPHYFLGDLHTGHPLPVRLPLQVMQPCEVTYKDWGYVLQWAWVWAEVLYYLWSEVLHQAGAEV